MSIWKPNQIVKDEQKQYVKKIETISAKFLKIGIEEKLQVNEFMDAVKFVSARLETSFSTKTVQDLFNREQIEKVNINN
jgi:hypothetical protein